MNLVAKTLGCVLGGNKKTTKWIILDRREFVGSRFFYD